MEESQNTVNPEEISSENADDSTLENEVQNSELDQQEIVEIVTVESAENYAEPTTQEVETVTQDTMDPETTSGTEMKANISEDFESISLENITWKINASSSTSELFDSSNAGAVFFYEPVLPEGYTLADGVSLPQIQVNIEENVQWAFSQSQTIDGIEITVMADPGVFPEGAILNVKKITDSNVQEKIEEAVKEEVKAEESTKTVEQLISFDITITDTEGNELQPDTSKGEVRVSFAQLPMVTEDIAPTQELKVFHMDDRLNEAKGLNTTVNQEAESVEATAEHFSVYTVAQLTDEIRANVEAEIKDSDGTLTYYDTIEEAITAAQGMSGSTVTLLKDVATESSVYLTSGVLTIDLNGKTWSCTSRRVIINGTANVTFKDSSSGGKIISTGSFTIVIDGEATLRLEGGTYQGGTTASIYNMIVNVGSLLAEGYAYKNGDGTWVTDMSSNEISNVTVEKAPIDLFSASVTEADDTVHYYLTIDKAIAAAMGMSGSTVTLLKDVAIEDDVNLTYGVLTIDLNGKTWSCTSRQVFINGTANVTAKDSGSGGKIISTGSFTVVIDGEATLRLEGGTYQGGTTASIYNVTGNVGSLLAEGYAYKNGDGTWVTDMSSNEISNVTVEKAPIDLFSASVTEADDTVHYYLTIDKAIAAAMGMSGSTVTLLKDVATESSVYLTSGVLTIDLNGKTWSCTSRQVFINGTANVTVKDSGSGGKIISTGSFTVVIDGEATLRLEGGTYQGGTTASIYNVTGNIGSLLPDGYVYIQESGSTVTDMSGSEVSNVTVRAIPVTITAQPGDAVAAPGYTEAPTFAVMAETVPADSGETITYQWYKDSVAIDSATNASYTVEPNLGEGTYTYYCAVTCDGYTVNSNNAMFYVTSVTGNYEVTESSGNTMSYPTLETAITAAKSKPNSTVQLLADATTSDRVEISSGTFTIDLNGKIWTRNASADALSLINGCHVTLMDSDTGGKLTTSTAQVTINVRDADLTIKSGIYENENSNSMSYVLGAYSSGTITIQGGTIQTSKSHVFHACFQSVDVVISGGTFNGGTVQFDSCDSGAFSGGSYSKIVTTHGVSLSALLATDYGIKTNNVWSNNPNETNLTNVTIQPVPVQITAPQNAANATYGYTSAPTMSVTATKTAAAPADSTVSYQWYRVKSGSETSDTALGTTATQTLPTGIDAGTHSFYCAVTCDGYIVNSESATFTVEKATPTITLDVIGYEVYGDEPIIYGNLMYFTATITGINGDYTDGTVTFMEGNNVLFADVAYSTDVHHYQKGSDDVPAGTHSFTAVYTPSADGTGKNYVGVTSSAVEQTITKADQSISITEVDGKKYKDADFTLETTGGKGTGAVTFSVPEGNGVLSISQKEDGRFDAAIIGAGEVTVTAIKAADTNYNEVTATQSITIEQADTSIAFQSSYTGNYFYTGSSVPNPEEADLSITGASYSDVSFVWYGSNSNQLDSPPTTPGNYILAVSIPETANTKSSSNTKSVTISSYDGTVTFAYNGNTTMAAWYSADVAITADGYTVSDSVNGTYADSYLLSGEGEVSKTLYFKQSGTGYITDGKAITANIDKTSPAFSADTDGIIISDNKWTEFLNNITFGHFFKENKDGSISATDSGSGVDKYYYYIDTGSTTAKTAEELNSISFTEGSSFSITDESKYIIYAYAVDQAGNRSAYICTDGIVIDKTAPTVMLMAPVGSDLGDVSATVKAQMNETGTITYVIKTTEQSSITAQNILDAADKKTVSVIDGQADTNLDVALSGLTANNTYYMYAVGTDSAENNGTVQSTNFTTTKTQPTFTADPTITGTYGQQVKDMTVSQVASTNGVAGSWSVSSTDKPSVGTAATYDVVFTPDDAVHYATVTVSVTPTITRKNLTATGVTIGEVTGTYTYDKTEKVPTVTVTDSEATITASDYEYSYSDNVSAGTATVTVTAKGNYTGSISRTFTITKAPAPSIDFPTANSISYGQKLSASALSVSSTEYGIFVWTDGSTVPTVANSGYEVTFVPNAGTVANYESITNTTKIVAITVSKVTPAVTVSTDISDDAGSRKATLTATVTGADDGEIPTGTVKFVNSTSGSDEDIAGATAVTITGGKATYTWTGLAKQIYKVKAVYNDSANYNTATSTELSFDTNKQNQAALNIGSIGTKSYGDETFTLSTTGGSGGGAVTFESSDPTIVSISGTTATIHKAGTVTITATKAANNTYNEVTASVSLTVGKKTLSVKAYDQLNIIKGAAMP